MSRGKVWLLVCGLLFFAGVSFVSFAHFVCIPAIEEQIEDSPRVGAVRIAQEVELYHAVHEKYPDRLEDLTMPDPKLDGRAYLNPDELRDPWGKPYQADFPTNETGKVRIWTVSPRGKTISNEKR